MSEYMHADVCWLDFMNKEQRQFFKLLEDKGFRCEESEGSLQVWRTEKYPGIAIELLDVDSMPVDPVSRIPGITAFHIDRDRRRFCGPHKIDPMYRFMVYIDTTYPDADNSGTMNLTKAMAELRGIIAKSCGVCLWESDGEVVPG